ncbi:TcaA NTF2-like domain-containing protein [Peribacillus butanolivorans]|uniref:TcaA NTF2-like domain-containing protein n=1 Tax=Peribacillus butanolivorans TaxID=421767 RepID=UPI003671E6DD
MALKIDKILKGMVSMVSILRIEGYEKIQQLFTTEQGVSVYVVTKKDNGQQYILRLAEFLDAKGTNQDFWYEKYEEYQLRISNFKQLPRVSTISMLDEKRLFTVLDYEEGTTLKAKGILGLKEIEQLVDAIRHLHSQKYIHGSISVENIWITNKNNRIVLYGAGEYKAIHKGTTCSESNDITQLVQIIKAYSNLDNHTLEKLDDLTPQTINEIIVILADASEDNTRKKKPGLVEQPDKKVPKPPIKEDTHWAQESSYDRNRTEREHEPETNIERSEKVIPEKEEQNNEQINRKLKRGSKFVSWLKVAAIGAVSVLALLFVIDVLSDPDSKKEVVTKVIEVQKEPEQATPVVQTESEQETVSFTNAEVEEFMRKYVESGIQAVNNNDFSLVEQLIDPSGKSYKDQQRYLDYLASKGITEEVVGFAVNDIVKVDKDSYKVSTNEQYEISYDDGSKKTKEFTSSYVLKVLEDGRLTVNELLYTQEVSSETSQEPTNDYTSQEPYEEDIYGEGSSINSDDPDVDPDVDSDADSGTDSDADFDVEPDVEPDTEPNVDPDTDFDIDSDLVNQEGVIEDVVRLHYGSISNEDFDTAYDSFSSSRQKKMSKNNWVKSLQKNMYDEITTIQVENVEKNTGRVYLEMTSYDDNNDGTSLVQDWTGYWNLLKENGRWTLDVADLKKVDSRVEQQ